METDNSSNLNAPAESVSPASSGAPAPAPPKAAPKQKKQVKVNNAPPPVASNVISMGSSGAQAPAPSPPVAAQPIDAGGKAATRRGKRPPRKQRGPRDNSRASSNLPEKWEAPDPTDAPRSDVPRAQTKDADKPDNPQAKRPPVKKPLPPIDPDKMFRKNAELFKLYYTTPGESVALRKLGIHALPRDEDWYGVVSPHPVSAAVRKLLTVRALSILYTLGQRKVYSVYGHERDLGFCKHLNTVPYLVPDQHKMQIVLHQPGLTPQDLMRGQGEVDDDDFSDGSILMVDVYETPLCSFTPGYVSTLLTDRNQYLVWIGHRFRGLMGHVFEEGVWARGEDGKIISFPDTSAQAYAPHNPCDWIWERQNYEDLSWCYKEVFGDYYVVLFRKWGTIDSLSLSPPPAFELQEVELPEEPKNWFTQCVFDWIVQYPMLHQFWPKQKMLVNNEIATMVSRALSMRTVGPYALKGIAANVRERLHDKAVWRRMEECFPKHFNLIVDKTVLAVLFRDLNQRNWLIDSTSRLNGQSMENYNTKLKNYGTSSAPAASSLGLIATVTVGFVGVFVMGWLKGGLKGKAFATGSASVDLSRTMERVKAFCDVRQEILALTRTQSKDWRAIFSEELSRGAHNLINFLWWIPTTPAFSVIVIAPFIEEVFKSIKPPYTAYFLAFYEVFLRLQQGFNIIAITPAFLMHMLTANMSFRQRLVIHMAFNMFVVVFNKLAFNVVPGSLGMVTWTWLFFALLVWWLFSSKKEKLVPGAAWIMFKNLTCQSKVAWNEIIETPEGMHEFPQELAAVPRSQAAPYNKPLTETMTCKGEFRGNIDETDNVVNHWFLPTNFPWFVPGRTDWNLTQTVKSRILTDPPMDPSEQAINWRDLWMTVRGTFPDPEFEIDHEDWKLPWLEKFEPNKKKRYIHQDKIAMEQTLDLAIKRGIQVAVKTNEAVSKLDEDEMVFICKPRPIAQVEPAVQYYLGPFIYGATQILKKEWRWDSEYLQLPNGWLMHVCWGSGITDLELSNWMYRVLESPDDSVHIIVAGDDSVVAVKKHGVVIFYESDARMFDQSQSHGPLQAERFSLKRLGVPQAAISKMEDVSFLPYVAIYQDKSRITISREERPIRDTGGADTTYGNTTVMEMGWASFFLLQNVLTHHR
jgi:hypothetical protein